MAPEQIKIKKGNLIVKWSNENEVVYPLQYLREKCPCAGCQGETILFTHYAATEDKNYTPESFAIAGVESVGGYAIKVIWKDGHDAGLYSWEYLKSIETTL